MADQPNGFKRHGENEYQAKFSESEREVLINLSEQIIELLESLHRSVEHT